MPATAAPAAAARAAVGPTPNRPMPLALPRPSRSSPTATAAPATAKSPERRANSSIAKPCLPVAAGKLTPVSNSSGSSAVVQMPVKNPAAGISRWPRGESASTHPSRARATAGYSAAGSAWASDPPIVPRLRIWKWPISAVARDSSGTRLAISFERPISASGGPPPGDQLRAADLRLGGARPDPDAVAALLDAAQRPDPADVDEVVEDREPHGEHRDQALPAGDHLRAVAKLREQAGGRLDAVRRVVLERGRLHRWSPA